MVARYSIFEVDHRQLHKLAEDPTWWQSLLAAMGATDRLGPLDFNNGVRILAQRQHDETLKLEIK